ncbi:hypothetical protein D3C86_1507220 [compost metagenome]
MYLINKQDGQAHQAILKQGRPFYHIPDVFNARIDGTQVKKRAVQCLGNDIGQRCFSNTRRAPEYHGWQLSALYGLPQYGVRPYQMLLPYIFVQVLWTHAFG